MDTQQRTMKVGILGATPIAVWIARALVTPDEHGHVGVTTPIDLTVADEQRESIRKAFVDQVQVHAAEPHRERRIIFHNDIIIVTHRDDDEHRQAIDAALEHGKKVISTSTDADLIDHYLHLGESEPQHRLVLGASFTGAATALLVAHGAQFFDIVDEVHIGVHLPAERAIRLGTTTLLQRPDWKQEYSVDDLGRELLWFPEPVGPQDCKVTSDGEALLGELSIALTQDHVDRVTIRKSTQSIKERVMTALPGVKAPPHAPFGAVRVELRGVRDGQRVTRVWGAVDRPQLFGGAVAAVVANAHEDIAAGVWSSATVVSPERILSSLYWRGFRVAEYIGIDYQEINTKSG